MFNMKAVVRIAVALTMTVGCATTRAGEGESPTEKLGRRDNVAPGGTGAVEITQPGGVVSSLERCPQSAFETQQVEVGLRSPLGGKAPSGTDAVLYTTYSCN